MIARPPASAEREFPFHLSVVATSRNDDHGGGLLRRMQHFVDGLAEQARRHRLAVELILVEWNPPADRPPLVEALRWPADSASCVFRIVTVPPEVHARLKHGDQLPLFQMIAKNVGIRRARGRYVLATNVDILFSDSMIRFLRDELTPGRLYRADRCDVPTDVPTDAPLERILEFCQRRMFRINTLGRTLVRVHGRWRETPTARPSATDHLIWLGQRFRTSLTRWREASRQRAAATRTSLAEGLGSLARGSRSTVVRTCSAMRRGLGQVSRSRSLRRCAIRLGALMRSAGRPAPHLRRCRTALARCCRAIEQRGVLGSSRSAWRWLRYRSTILPHLPRLLTTVLTLAGRRARRWLAAGARRAWGALEATTTLAGRAWRAILRGAGRLAWWPIGPSLRAARWLARQVSAMASAVRESAGRLRRRLGRIWREDRLFTNACGDFTLLSRDDWFELRGYPEWEIFSWHLDSVLLYQANRNGIREAYAGRRRRIFHIEHGTGSGYTPEGAADLFARLDARGIPYLTWPGFLAVVAEMDALRGSGQPVVYNASSWGLADEDLPERVVRGDDVTAPAARRGAPART
jgi:hypothetical protein